MCLLCAISVYPLIKTSHATPPQGDLSFDQASNGVSAAGVLVPTSDEPPEAGALACVRGANEPSIDNLSL